MGLQQTHIHAFRSIIRSLYGWLTSEKAMVSQEIYTSLIVCPCKLLFLVFSYKAHFFVKKCTTPREKKGKKKNHLKNTEPLNAQSSFSYLMPMEYLVIRLCSKDNENLWLSILFTHLKFKLSETVSAPQHLQTAVTDINILHWILPECIYD